MTGQKYRNPLNSFFVCFKYIFFLLFYIHPLSFYIFFLEFLFARFYIELFFSPLFCITSFISCNIFFFSPSLFHSAFLWHLRISFSQFPLSLFPFSQYFFSLPPHNSQSLSTYISSLLSPFILISILSSPALYISLPCPRPHLFLFLLLIINFL